MIENNQPQNQQNNNTSILPEQKSKVSKTWMYAAIVSIIILVLFILSDKYPAISLKWVIAVMAIYCAYKIWAYYESLAKRPSFKKMKNVAVEYAKKEMGLGLDDSLNNCFCEPLGSELWGLWFVSEGITFIIYKNILVGSSPTPLFDLKNDFNKISLQRMLAEKGITEGIQWE